MRVILLAFGILLPAVGGQLPSMIRTAGPGYDGVIISPEAQLASDRDIWLRQRRNWTPTDAQVRELEAQLRVYIKSRDAASALQRSRIPSELSRYKRQYWGTGNGRKREIRIRFYHEDSPSVRGGAWLADILTIKGGGDWYFRLTYRVEERRFLQLAVNGPE